MEVKAAHKWHVRGNGNHKLNETKRTTSTLLQMKLTLVFSQSPQQQDDESGSS